jgi:hypothetical protein
MQRLSERYADGSFWPVAGYSTDLLIAHGVATSDHHGYSNGQYYSTTTYDEFGVDGGCRELRTFIWHPNATYTVSQYNTNAFTGHRDSTDTGYSSYGEPTPVTGSEFSSATYPDNTIVTTITIYLTNFYRYYSGRYYSDGAMMNGPPKSGYLGGGLTHGWSNNEHPTPFYNFLHAGIDPLAVDALMTTGHMPTMKSQAAWMTTADARMPAALGLVAFPSAAQMCPANTDYWTRMPWSAPAHDHTPRFESIPLHEPDGTGTGESESYAMRSVMQSVQPLLAQASAAAQRAAVDQVFASDIPSIADFAVNALAEQSGAGSTSQRRWTIEWVKWELCHIRPDVGAFWRDKIDVVSGANPWVEIVWRDGGAHIDKVIAHVPDNWTSMKVTQFIFQELRDNPELRKAVEDYYARSPLPGEERVTVGRKDEFGKACTQIAAVLSAGVAVAVSLTPGGLYALLISDLAEGAFAEALFDTIPFLPVKQIGSTTLRFVFKGGKEVKVEATVVKVLWEMAPEEKAALKAFLQNKSAAEAEKILATFGPLARDAKGSVVILSSAYQKEIDFAHEMASLGNNVVLRGKDLPGGDLIINGILCELKTLEAATINAVSQNIRTAAKQAKYIYIDGRAAGLTFANADAGLAEAIRKGYLNDAVEVRILTKYGVRTWRR